MEFGGDNMNEAPDVAAIVEIFSNSARVKMVDMLMDGRAHTVNELALAAKITPQTATYHLQKMVGLNWLKLEKYGRFHYYTLIRSDVATLFETLSPVAPEKKVASLNKSLKYKKLYFCRTCYDHVAGRIGVAITDKLIENGAIALESANFNVTQSGRTFLSSTFNLNLDELMKKKRAFCKPCLDWSERKDHVGGAVGHGILTFLLDHEYLVRGKDARALAVTDSGHDFLEQRLQLSI